MSKEHKSRISEKKERRRSFCKKKLLRFFVARHIRICSSGLFLPEQKSYKIVIIMQLYLSRKKCYSENNTDTKAERGAKSIRRKKGGNKMEFVFEHATMIAVIAVVVIILAILASGYVKAPPDTAFIISGFQKGQRILIGKAGIKLPFFERLDKLSLKLVAIDVKTSDAVPTADYINIQVDAAVNIKVGVEPQKLQKASQNFLNRDSEYIAKVAREVLEGNMREIVGKMRLEEMVSTVRSLRSWSKKMQNRTWLRWDLTSSASTYRISSIPIRSLKTSVSTIS